MKIGIESTAYFDLFDYEEGLKKAKAHGFDCIDFQGATSPNSIVFNWDEKETIDFFTKMHDYAKSIGIEIFQLHGLWPTNDLTEKSRNLQVKYFIKEMQIANLLGSKYLVVHPVMPYGWRVEEDANYSWKLNKEFILNLLPYAKKYDVCICLENIPVNMQLGHVEYVNKLVNEINDANFKMCFDTGHANVVKDDIKEAIKLLGNNLKCLHVHDNKSHSDEHICPYFGSINWDDFTSGLKEIKYDGCISLETHINEKMPEDIKLEMQLSLAKIAKHLARKVEL